MNTFAHFALCISLFIPGTIWAQGVLPGERQSSMTTVTLTLDLRQAFFNGAPPDSVALWASFFYQNMASSNKRVQMHDETGDGVWMLAFDVNTRSDRDFYFRFAYLVEDQWIDEALPGNEHHVALLDESPTLPEIAMVFSPLEGITVVSTTEALVDDLDEILAELDTFDGLVDETSGINNLQGGFEPGGGHPRKGMYHYFKALKTLRTGNDVLAAEAAYALYRLQGGMALEAGDDYYFAKAQALEDHGSFEEAEEVLEDAERESVNPARGVRFALQRARLLHRTGRIEEARAFYKRIKSTYRNQKEEVTAASYFEATSYLEANEETTFDSLHTWLFADIEAIGDTPSPVHANTSPEGRWRRRGLLRLAQAHESADNLDHASSLYEQISQEGTPYEQLQAKMLRWKMDLYTNKPSSVLREVESLLPQPQRADSIRAGLVEIPPTLRPHIVAAQKPHYQARLRLLQAEALAQLGFTNQERAIYQYLIDHFGDSPEAHIARQRLDS